MKRFLISLLCMALLLVGSADYAIAVSAEDIYIAEPFNFNKVEAGRSFLAANIKNFEEDGMLYLTISERKNCIDASVIKESSSISQLRLTVPQWPTPVGTICPLGLGNQSEEEYAANVTETIEQYFLLKEKVEALQDGLDSSHSEEYKKSVVATYEWYKTRYKFLFEEIVFADVVDSPSYYTTLGDFEVGEYTIRFLDEDYALIKEFNMEIIEPVEDEQHPSVVPTEELAQPMEVLENINVIETPTYDTVDCKSCYGAMANDGKRVESEEKMDE